MAKSKRDLLAEIKKLQADILVLEGKSASLTKEQIAELDKLQKKIVDRAKTVKQINVEQQKNRDIITGSIAEQEQGIKSIGASYKPIQDLERQRVKSLRDSGTQHKGNIAALGRMQSINEQIANLSADDVVQRESLQAQFNEELNSLDKRGKGIDEQINMMTQANGIAQQYSNLTEEQKEKLEQQRQVLQGIQDTVGGVLDTFSTLTSGPLGFLGTALIGAGFAMDKISATARETGYFFNEMALSATAFGLVFDEAQAVAKGLSTELGGVEQATFGAQLNANLLAVNLNLSGGETAKLIGGFARLGDGTAQAGADMAQLVHDASKAAGVIPADVAGDLAANTEKFAEYGKDGGKNMIQAAIAAKKLGLEMSSLTNVTDGLLDIENSLTSELELGALLGKNINFEQARRLAYEGEIGSAVKSAIQQLGGVEEFNKMDIYQKREAAKALGLSVEELQKMTSNMDKLNADGSLQVSTFDRIGQSLSAIAKGPLGSFMKGVGGAAVAMGQMGFDVKSMASKVPVLGKLFDKLPGKGAAAGGAPSVAKTPTVPKGGGGAIAGKGSITQSMSKINMNAVLKGAAALVIVAAAVFVFGKAVQEFMKVSWSAVGMAVVSMLALVASVALLGAIMMSGVGAVAILAGAAAMLVIASSVLILGHALQAIGKGFEMMGAGIQTLVPNLTAVGSSVLGLVAMIVPIGLLSYALLGLSGSIMVLAGSLAFLGVAGLAALPALMGLQMIGGISATIGGLFGGGDEGGGDEEGVVSEIQGLREDLANGKIAVYLDGAKVSSGIRNVVNGTSVNSYGL